MHPHTPFGILNGVVVGTPGTTIKRLSLPSLTNPRFGAPGASAGAATKRLMAAEKVQVSQIDLERLGEEQGYRLDVRAFDKGEELKTASDGRTVLIPQPTDHASDPLAWSSRKKHTTLFTITMISFLADFGSAIGIPSVIPQAMYSASSLLPSSLC